MSKPLVHIRVSEKENYLHEHEIFEMMRSRHLYQMQFDLRRKLEKRIRAIELAEKVHLSTFRSRKTVFLNKMREKIRQKDPKSYTQNFDLREIFELDKDFEDATENADNESFPKIAENSDEIPRNKLRSKSLVNIIPIGVSENSDRPVTSRSVVSLHGKTFEVAKSSSRQKSDDKTLVTEMTMYADDFITEFADMNKTENSNIVISGQCKDDHKPGKARKVQTFKINGINPLNARPLSLPPIERVDLIKSLATFEMGTLTPDGHLLLTRDDYETYMDNFRRKREKRLHRSRRLSKSLDQRVRDFTIEEEDYS